MDRLLNSLSVKSHIDIREANTYNAGDVSQFLYNPKSDAAENYRQTSFTGYASIDRPHIKYFKKGTLEAKLPKMKMYDYIFERNKARLNFDALNYYGKKITYKELFYHIEQTAKSFLKIGVREGDYVVISLPTIPESVYILFALNRINAIPIELDPRTSEEEIKTTLKESGAHIYATFSNCLPVIERILSKDDQLNRQIKYIIGVSPAQSFPLGLKCLFGIKQCFEGIRVSQSINEKHMNWKSFVKLGQDYCGKIDSPYKENCVAEIIYSSGTTATPKPIQYTNETFTSVVRQVELGENNYREKDKNLDIIPLFLGFGSTNGLYTILAFGMEDILMPVPVIDELPKLINKYKPNHILGAPIHMKVLLNYLQAHHNFLKDMSFLKSLVSGSAHLESAKQYALDDELKQRRCSIKVGPGYGQNEAGPGLCFSSDTFLKEKKPGCSGYPLIFTTVSIFDPESDEELKYGENLEGEIRYKTPSVMKGYAFHYNAENQNFFKKGKDGTVWCCSGDLGKIDKDGGVYITGRKTRQIGRGGFKFSPTEIEELIVGNISSVESCAVVAKPDITQENVPILYYSVKPEHKNDAAAIKKEIIALCGKLKEYKIPAEYIEKSALPLTPNLKIDFKKLEREAIEQGQ